MTNKDINDDYEQLTLFDPAIYSQPCIAEQLAKYVDQLEAAKKAEARVVQEEITGTSFDTRDDID